MIRLLALLVFSFSVSAADLPKVIEDELNFTRQLYKETEADLLKAQAETDRLLKLANESDLYDAFNEAVNAVSRETHITKKHELARERHRVALESAKGWLDNEIDRRTAIQFLAMLVEGGLRQMWEDSDEVSVHKVRSTGTGIVVHLRYLKVHNVSNKGGLHAFRSEAIDAFCQDPLTLDLHKDNVGIGYVIESATGEHYTTVQLDPGACK